MLGVSLRLKMLGALVGAASFVLALASSVAMPTATMCQPGFGISPVCDMPLHDWLETGLTL